MKYLEEEKVNLATYVLQGQAKFWWQALQRTRFSDQEGPIPWEEFLELFRAKYFLDHVQEQKEREFAELVQGSLSVADYEARFFALGRYAPHIFDNPEKSSENSWMVLRATSGDMLPPMI